MPIPFTCPHCGAETEVADEYAGQTGPCARCGRSIAVPPLAGQPGYAHAEKQSSAVQILAVLGGVGIVILLCAGIPAILVFRGTAAAPPARRAMCINNLKQIGVAMHNYLDTNGCFPPAYVADEDGNPMVSWRLLLLPYMEQEPLYRRYDFDEPWDSPKNRAVTSTVLTLYNCPSAGMGRPQTDYVMIVGPDTISDGPTSTSIASFGDGTSRTILVVEIPRSGIHWAEPRDLDVEQLGSLLRADDGTPPGGNHPGKVHVLFADGSVQTISEDIDPETLRALTTIAGGEDVDPWQWQQP